MAPNDTITRLVSGRPPLSSVRNGDDSRQQRPRVVLLSTSLMAHRMLVHSNPPLVDSQTLALRVWATSDHGEADDAGIFESFPEVRPFPEFPHNYLRRLNDYAWDVRLKSPSRESMWRYVRSQRERLTVRALKVPAAAVTALGLEEVLERWLQTLLGRYERSSEAAARLRDFSADVLFTTSPHRYAEPAVVAEAKRLGIPTLAFITSWDNITTKNRMPFRHDGYLVWSERMKAELLHHYPHTRRSAIYVVGAPQFDAFFQARFRETRSTFCARTGLDPARPVILYALGSPNFLHEHAAVLYLAEKVASGELGDSQLLVRPHPLFHDKEAARILASFGSSVRVQRMNIDTPALRRSQSASDVLDWVSTFRHADVVVNLSSTATVDAAICDRPVVNLDFDPEPGQPRQQLIKDINHRWPHFKPVAESGGVWLVDSLADMVDAVRGYLAHPDLHHEGRRWIAEYVCGFTDGRSGARVAEAVREFALRHARTATASERVRA